MTTLDPAIADRLKRTTDGLVPAVVQQHDTGEVLMLGWMDDEALARTLTTGRATYWSRSRQEYWLKGETSGHVQWVKEVRLDCDGDTLLVKVDQVGAACHTGDRTCFDADLLLAMAEPGLDRRDLRPGRAAGPRRRRRSDGDRRQPAAAAHVTGSTTTASPVRPRAGPARRAPAAGDRARTGGARLLGRGPGDPGAGASRGRGAWELIASIGALVTSVVGLVTEPGHLEDAIMALGVTGVDTFPTIWGMAAVLGSAVSVVGRCARGRGRPRWPEMGSRYDAPGSAAPAAPVELEDQSNLDLWKAMDEGRDPTA